jgi:hypothetical protein
MMKRNNAQPGAIGIVLIAIITAQVSCAGDEPTDATSVLHDAQTEAVEHGSDSPLGTEAKESDDATLDQLEKDDSETLATLDGHAESAIDASDSSLSHDTSSDAAMSPADSATLDARDAEIAASSDGNGPDAVTIPIDAAGFDATDSALRDASVAEIDVSADAATDESTASKDASLDHDDIRDAQISEVYEAADGGPSFDVGCGETTCTGETCLWCWQPGPPTPMCGSSCDEQVMVGKMACDGPEDCPEPSEQCCSQLLGVGEPRWQSKCCRAGDLGYGLPACHSASDCPSDAPFCRLIEVASSEGWSILPLRTCSAR